MSEPEQRDSVAADAAARRRWHPLLLLAISFGFGVIVFLATQSPAAGAVFPLFAGGLRTFSSGRWVLKHDPNRIRARICFAYYVATACGQAAVAALISVILFVAISLNGGNVPNLEERALATMLVLYGGMLLGAFVGVYAIWGSFRHGVRVWIHPRLPALYRRSLDSPHVASRRFRVNYAHLIVYMTLFVPLTVALGAVLALLADKGAGNPPSVMALASLCFSPFVALLFYHQVAPRVVLNRLSESWPFTETAGSVS